MQSKELAKKLRSYANGGHVDRHGRRSPNWKGQRSFALFFAEYLESIDFSQEEKFEFWRIEPHLPQLVVEAFDALRLPTTEFASRYKKMYEDEVERSVPDIITLGASNLSDQGISQRTVGYMLSDIFGNEQGEHISSIVERYCSAQFVVLQQVFDKFLLKVWREEMFEFVDKCTKKGMSGTFGKTEFRVYSMAGRVMFTFARKIKKDKPSMYKKGENLILNEHQVSFVGEDGSRLCLGAGLQSVYTDLQTATSMIEDVIKNWADKKKRKKIFTASESVSIM